ncbi:hypothetical protein P8629_02245 [Hydrogenovibrio sp. 3SP14C1]|uniref:hypothetical protein n=1 Tax=Hydrogenovibrio sp. 3SP14C1 TaxID=3038774 RepID=UPI00241742C7|nr:hypothetical protein [Hydrogenovibrio sp. 3SP14C1]MDG4811815.1 hypothetical protein [Hydrogenovibrio sp. 3SP14C1]
MTQAILLTGLPGVGKTRFKFEFEKQSSSVPVFELDLTSTLSPDLRSFQSCKVWCLIDIRSKLDSAEAEQVLKQMLVQSSGVILSFVDQADLVTQSYWQSWLAKNIGDQELLPRFRWFSTGLPSDWDWQNFGSAVSVDEIFKSLKTLSPLAHYESMHFVYDYTQGAHLTNLDHLLLGLDASKQNLGMKLWRVQGVVKTTEYVNPVALEGTVNRWDTFAGELENESGWLKIEGLNLDKEWLQQIMDASLL